MTRRGGAVQLSKRLGALADMVPVGKRVVDVGCDHAFLDIRLVQSGKTPGAIAMDVRKGPLAAAEKHISDAGLDALIETRLSDGLREFHAGEAEVLVCAGMGGPLMRRILTDEPEKTESFEEMILQPQSELLEFRGFLREQGFDVLDERIILEDGKYYFPMRVSRGNGARDGAGGFGSGIRPPREDPEICDRFGELLLKRKEPLLREYLLQQQTILNEILKRMEEAGSREERAGERMREVRREAEYVKEALERME